MKKVIRICVALSLLSLDSCDFLRVVAGRPTLRDLEEKAELIEAEKAARVARDSAAARQRKMEAALEAERNNIEEIRGLGVQFSSLFRFGEPVSPLRFKYNLIVGVYRNPDTAQSYANAARKAGFDSFFICFDNGARALCLCGTDNIEEILTVLSKADTKVCPHDAWIYVNE